MHVRTGLRGLRLRTKLRERVHVRERKMRLKERLLLIAMPALRALIAINPALKETTVPIARTIVCALTALATL